MTFARKPLSPEDIAAYRDRAQNGPCFVCGIVDGTNPYDHHIIYEDSKALAFLTLGQIMYGWSLVCPR